MFYRNLASKSCSLYKSNGTLMPFCSELPVYLILRSCLSIMTIQYAVTTITCKIMHAQLFYYCKINNLLSTRVWRLRICVWLLTGKIFWSDTDSILYLSWVKRLREGYSNLWSFWKWSLRVYSSVLSMPLSPSLLLCIHLVKKLLSCNQDKLCPLKELCLTLQ